MDALSQDAFIQLVKVLSAEKILELNRQGLPNNLPIGVLDTLPPGSRGAVEQLLESNGSSHPDVILQDPHCAEDDLVTALNQAKATEDITKIRLFKDKVRHLMPMLTRPNSQAAHSQSDQAAINIEHINRLLIDVHCEHRNVVKVTQRLENMLAVDAKTRSKIDKTIGRLRLQSKRIMRLLGEFYLLRYKKNEPAIRDKTAQISDQPANSLVKEEFYALCQGFESSRARWRRLIAGQQTQYDRNDLRLRITAAKDEIRANQIILIEEELIEWLQAIEKADLNPYSKPRITESVQQAKTALQRLLEEYCNQCEESALQIALAPFLENTPERVIEDIFTSEQVFLEYLSDKKRNTALWISVPARKRLKSLMRTKRRILGKLSQSQKVHR